MPSPASRPHAPWWLCGAAIALFAVYAANFTYFFVDDEAIPYVYAQNLLHGRGLSYSVLEGRVEGYSDFLHLWQAAGILSVVTALHMPKWSVFFIGKGISLACGVALLFVTWRVLNRLRVGPYGAAAGLSIVCFSGPVAVWSNSSLETMPFALGVMVLVWALVSERDGAALASAAFLVLERIDGPIFAGALLAAFAVCSDDVRRRALLLRVVAPLAVLLVAYHAGRYWYFRDLLPPPVESKILYRVSGGTLVTKAPASGYLVRFLGTYGWVAAAIFSPVLLVAIRAGGALRALTLAVFALVAYVALVGDWMFGFRFFTPIVPVAAVVSAAVVARVTVQRRRVGVAFAALWIGWSAVTGLRFVSMYRQAEHVEPFLLSPSGDLHRFFHPYFGLYEAARSVIAPPDVVAYNQAGFLPFMLDVTNIDDLGIVSRFYAELPTTDLFYTEVGRYRPLTDKRELNAGEAYLLYRNARYVIVRTDLLLSANRGVIPRELLGGYYRLLLSDPEGDNVIYRRTDLVTGRFANDPHAFVENIAHVSYIRHASIDGREVVREQYLRTFPFLRDAVGAVEVNGSTAMDVIFAPEDEEAFAVTVQEVRFDTAVSMEMLLFDMNRRPVFRQRIELEPRRRRSIRLDLPPGTHASRFELQLSAPGGVAHGSIEDLRVQGQTPALEKYIARTLSFPAPR